MRFTQQHLIHAVLFFLSALGLWIIYSMLDVNTIRGDEFLSYLHSDPRWSYTEIITHIHGGADNSYVHAVVLRCFFELFGYTIVVQRAVSFLAWGLGLWVLYGIIKPHMSQTMRYVALLLIGFSNSGFFLATDGRFYSLLFCCALISLFCYLNRKKWSHRLVMCMFIVIQFAGLLTSAGFVVFQLLFLIVVIGVRVFSKNRALLVESIPWVLCVLLPVVVYFTWLKIPYYHFYFLTGIVTEVPFSQTELKTFVSIPFRWFFLPHFPLASDEVDGVLFLLLILGLIGYYRDIIFRKPNFKEEREVFVVLMAVGVLLGLMLQLLLYVVKGYPLWESRYYAAVFFVVPLALILVLKEIKTIKMLVLIMCLWMFRMVGIEHSKIEERRNKMKEVEHLQSTILERTKPTLFIEQLKNRQSSVFGMMGNLYVRYPATREKLFLKIDTTEQARKAYFERLSGWRYPLGTVTEIDSEVFYLITPEGNP